jgi:hypothetical protein
VISTSTNVTTGKNEILHRCALVVPAVAAPLLPKNPTTPKQPSQFDNKSGKPTSPRITRFGRVSLE